MEKPAVLYRGVKLNHELFRSVPLYGVELKPHYDPIIDSRGRKTVADGNEYGVYMTDNLTMVQSAYARVDMADGLMVRKDLAGLYPALKVPAVGVTYEIWTEGVDAHQPWITDYLQGHYNNGFEGHEWVAESVPADKYLVVGITIGPDWLHEAERVDVSDITAAKEKVNSIIEARSGRLESLGEELAKLSAFKRTHLSFADRELYKDLFGPGGALELNVAGFEPRAGQDYVRYLTGVFFHGTREDLDYKSLQYIQTLKSRLKDGDGLDELVGIIKDDIAVNAENRKAFAQRKREDGETFNTVGFDTREERYNNMLYVLRDKTKTRDKGQLVTDRDQDGLVPSVEKLVAKAWAWVNKNSGKQHDVQVQHGVGKLNDNVDLRCE